MDEHRSESSNFLIKIRPVTLQAFQGVGRIVAMRNNDIIRSTPTIPDFAMFRQRSNRAID